MQFDRHFPFVHLTGPATDGRTDLSAANFRLSPAVRVEGLLQQKNFSGLLGLLARHDRIHGDGCSRLVLGLNSDQEAALVRAFFRDATLSQLRDFLAYRPDLNHRRADDQPLVHELIGDQSMNVHHQAQTLKVRLALDGGADPAARDASGILPIRKVTEFAHKYNQYWPLLRILSDAHRLRAHSGISAEECCSVFTRCLFEHAPRGVLSSLRALRRKIANEPGDEFDPKRSGAELLYQRGVVGKVIEEARNASNSASIYQRVIEHLDYLARFDGGNAVTNLLGSRAEPGATTLFADLLSHDALPEQALLALLRHRPDLDARFRIDIGGTMVDGLTVMHLATVLNSFEKVDVLIRAGAPIAERDSTGRTPLHVFLNDSRITSDRRVTERLIQSGAETAPAWEGAIFGAQRALEKGDFGSAELLVGRGCPLPPSSVSPPGYDREAWGVMLQSMMRLSTGLHPQISRSAGEIYRVSGSEQQVLLYLQAARDSLLFYDGDRQGAAMVRLLPHLMFTHSTDVLIPLWQAIENHMDNNKRHWHWHPNEAELLLLLAHPKHEIDRTLSPLILAFTSTHRLLNHSIELKGSSVSALQHIGITSHEFRKWRFDVTPPDGINAGNRRPSLFERYGFQRMLDLDEPNPFGTAFVLLPGTKRFSAPTREFGGRQRLFDPQTTLLFRHGVVMISHPYHGTCAVRNSSLTFGRDLLLHPAYWSALAVGRDLSVRELHALTPADVEDQFASACSASVQRTQLQDAKHLDFLMTQLAIFKYDYARWKFDTRRQTAFSRDTASKPALLLGGFHSEGFGEVVGFLEERERARQKNLLAGIKADTIVPDLAFCNPEYPFWAPYPFSDMHGRQRETIRVTSHVLEVLRLLVENRATDDDLRDTNLRNFFQQAGFWSQGELVLVAPERPAK